MEDFTDLLEQSVVEPTEADLEAVKRYAKQLVRLETEISDAEAELARLKQDREELRRVTLPQLMLELGVDSLTADNRTIVLEPLVSASLPKEYPDRKRAIDWLVDNNHGGVIKRELKVDLPKGDAATEGIVVDAIQSAAPNLLVDVGYNIHHATYTALAKQLVRDGAPFPADVLNVFVGSIVKVKEK